MTRADFTSFAALFALACSLVALTLFGVARGDDETPTLRVLRAIPVHYWDKHEGESLERRDERLREMASAIDEASKYRIVRGALIVLARRESGLASYVYEDRCSDGPAGKLECDHGRAVGPFQTWPTKRQPVPDDIKGRTELAASLWRFGRKRCRRMVEDDLVGAFSSYGSGGRCSPTKNAKSRAAETRAIVRRLW